MTPEEARRANAQLVAVMGGDPEPGISTEDLAIDGPAGAIPARIYRSQGQDPATPLTVFAHFGGGVIGDLDTCPAFCTILARIGRGPVLSVDYRLAPEQDRKSVG